ncbi:MAG: YidC/Oxa1 family insertase periplasmic-domain containing protein [Candidatus Omnitrophota bacterium]
MEQKTLIAITLTLLVLIAFNFPAKKSGPVYSVKEDYLVRKDSEQSIQPNFATPDKIREKLEEKTISEDVQTIENKEVKIYLTNIGGSIKSIEINQHSLVMPVKGLFNIVGYSSLDFDLKDADNEIAAYEFRDNEVAIQKTYDISSNDDTIKTEIVIENISNQTISKEFSLINFSLDTSELDGKLDSPRDYNLFEYSYSINHMIERKGNAYKFSPKDNLQRQGFVDWVGFRDRYFCIVIKPEYTTTGLTTFVTGEKSINIMSQGQKIDLHPKEKAIFRLISYVGPQDTNRLKSYNKGFEEIFVFSKFSALDFIGKSVVRAMNFVHGFIPNWGVCVILIGLLVNGALYPLTLSSMKSMKKMQLIQPEMAKLREQYKNNPQRLNKEMMVLYKEHGVNPLGGCLPMILQMPIFISVYQAMWRNVSLKGANFLWITDLSRPDHLFKLPFKFPIGNVEYFNILPIIIMALMFIQQKLTSKNMVVTDPNQAAQQRMMQVFLPLFIGMIFYKFSSGLALYFTTFYLFSIATQIKMSKITVMK